MAHSLISIIVPVYNGEQYLNMCIRSIVEQTYPHLEIILVDDGSSDGSPQICDEWAKQDSRIKVIHKENGGAATARNVGLDVASGEYIGFVDGDDCICRDMYQQMLSVLQQKTRKLVCCYSLPIAENEEYEPKTVEQEPLLVQDMDIDQATNAVLCFKMGTAVWRRLYHRSLFEGVRFPEGEVNEDYPPLIPQIVAAGGTVLINQKLYYYRHRVGSVTDTLHLSKHALECSRNNLQLMQRQCAEYGISCERAFSLFAAKNAYTLLLSMEKARAHGDAPEKELLHDFRKIVWTNKRAFLTSDRVSFKDKVLFSLLLMRLLRPIYRLRSLF